MPSKKCVVKYFIDENDKYHPDIPKDGYGLQFSSYDSMRKGVSKKCSLKKLKRKPKEISMPKKSKIERAIEKLAIADLKYEKAVIEKYGEKRDDSDLYVKITGNPWTNYLKVGGSRTMINRGVKKNKDFGATYRRLKKLRK